MSDVWFVDEMWERADVGILVSSPAGFSIMRGWPSWWNTGTSGGGSSGSANSPQMVLAYRRSTHDENGNPKSLNQAQEQAWTDSWPIGAMTSDVIWRTAEEIAQAANAYIQLVRATGNIYYSPEAVSEILSGLVVYGVVELRTV